MKHSKTIALVMTGLIALYFVIDRVFPYTNFNIEQYRDYWPEKWWLVGHLLGGMTAILIGPFQFSKQFRNRYLKVHRTMGKIYLIAILIGSICAFYILYFASGSNNTQSILRACKSFEKSLHGLVFQMSVHLLLMRKI